MYMIQLFLPLEDKSRKFFFFEYQLSTLKWSILAVTKQMTNRNNQISRDWHFLRRSQFIAINVRKGNRLFFINFNLI